MVDTDIPQGVDLLGKQLTDLQENIEVGDDAISGTLKYITGWTAFSGDVSEQSGNYIALHIDTEIPADSITVELTNGTVGHPVALDEDRTIILRISDKDTQTIEIVAKAGTATITKEYELTGLTLNQS